MLKTRKLDIELNGKIIKKAFEVPEFWSDRAALIVASKYATDTENSVLDIIDRVVNEITHWGNVDKYFLTQVESDTFSENLKDILINQRGTFNSPVWFNIGVSNQGNSASACFLATIKDKMEDILEHNTRAGKIFKSGSGVGFNVSKLRAKGEKLSNKGESSGPLSFMKFWDEAAGAIKSGGKCLAPWQKVYTEKGPIQVKDLTEKDFCVISYDPPSKRFKAKRAKAWKQDNEKEIVRITTDKGSFVTSVDHPIKINGTKEYIQAKNLKLGMSLFQGSIDLGSSKYIRIHLRSGDKEKELFHRMIAKDILKKNISKKVVHHKDENGFNNSLENLEIISSSEHSFLHGKKKAEKGEHIFQNNYWGQLGMENPMHKSSNFWKDPKKVATFKEKQSKNMTRIRAKKMQSLANKKQMMNLAYKLINKEYDLSTYEGYYKARIKETKGIGISKKKQLKKITDKFGSYINFYNEIRQNNHKVISIESLGVSNVYSVEVECLTKDDKSKNSGHNYLIWPEENDTNFGSGIVVSNTRRSAVLVGINDDHPDVEEFIECKSKEEKKANLLIDGGVDPDEAFQTVAFQNANHSIVVSDNFMKAVKEDKDWHLINRGDKEIVKTIKAKELFDKIAKQAWETGDPGLQFIDTINKFNPLQATGIIENSNPCLTGDMRILTSSGYVQLKNLVNKKVDFITLDGLPSAGKVWSTGIKKVISLKLKNGKELKCTANHIWQLKDGSKCEAKDLLNKKLNSFSFSPVQVIEINDAGKEEVFDFEEPALHWGIVEGFIAHNCGEVYLPPWGCCQLFCLNLPKYLAEDNSLNHELLEHDISIIVKAMDILISSADYPTKEFDKEAKETRPLGIGATDLAGYLIKKELAYNSEDGRETAQEIISYITWYCIKSSYFLAKKLGPFERWEEEKKHTIETYNCIIDNITKVIGKKREFYTVLDNIKKDGIRNCTVTALAPNGTTGFMVDSDGTGIEPLFALKQIKTLSGGGTIEMIPNCVDEYVKSNSIFPDKEILLTANKIHWKDHIKMTAALQEVISMGISKTINLPSDATVEDVKEAYIMAWELGCKGITVYRDGSKTLQPLKNASKKEKIPEEKIKIVSKPIRKKLPSDRESVCHKIDIAGFEGYLHVGLYEDNSLGEIFIRASKQGSFLLGMLDSFATMVSLGLQYGVPLETLVEKFKGQQFQPNGITQNEKIRFCSSIIDYIFKYLEINYINRQLDLSLETKTEVKQNSLEGPPCINCGGPTEKSGTCYYCTVCGESTGCS